MDDEAGHTVTITEIPLVPAISPAQLLLQTSWAAT